MRRLIYKFLLNRYIKEGLQISRDCRLMGLPKFNIDFGSEPYLVSIGRHVTIAGRVQFITHDGGTFVFRQNPKYKKVIKFGRIIVGDNCFIGYGSIILPGVTVGDNSIVAAGSVVTKDVPPDSIVGGNPAKLITSSERYAEKCLENTPEYDINSFQRDMKPELLRIFPYPW